MRLFWFLLNVCMVAGWSACISQQTQSPSSMNTGEPETMDSLWTTFDQQFQKQQYRSALKVLGEIEELANSGEEWADLHRAWTLRFETNQNLKGVDVALEEFLERDTHNLEGVRQALYDYQKATAYFHYFRQQGHDLGTTNITGAPEGEDFSQWSGGQFRDRILSLYRSALDPLLTSAKVEDWQRIVKHAQSRHRVLQPTLFELLALEILENVSDYNMERVTARESAIMNDARWFAGRSEFLDWQPADSSDQWKVDYDIFFRLLRHSSTRVSRDWADLQRLTHGKRHSTHPDRDRLYLEGLHRLLATEPDTTVAAYALLAKADFFLSHRSSKVDSGMNGYQKAALVLNESLLKGSGDSLIQKEVLERWRQIEMPEMRMELEEVGLPGQPQLCKVHLRNLDEVQLEVYPYDPESKEAELFRNRRKFKNWIAERAPFWKKTYSLPEPGDYSPLSCELALKALPAGSYFIAARAQNAFYAGKFSLSGLAFYVVEDQVVVVDREKGSAVAGAEVHVTDGNRQRGHRDTLVTDRNGLASVPFRERTRYQVIKVQTGEDVLYGSQYIGNYRNHSSHQSLELVFFTDRSIYRPGQTIYFKGVLLDNERAERERVISQHPITIELQDQQRQGMGTVDLQTDEFGAVSGSFTLPSSAAPGRYELHAGSYGRQSISVAEYKWPGFQLKGDWEGDRALAIGDEVVFRGKVETFSGFPMAEEEVEYTIYRQRAVHTLYSIYPPRPNDRVRIGRGTVITDKDGSYEIRFQGEGPQGLKDPSEFRLELEVTDAGGETRALERSIMLNTTPYIWSFQLPDRLTPSALDSSTFEIKNTLGRNIPFQGEIRLHALDGPDGPKIERYWSFPDTILMSRSSFDRQFPQYSYTSLSMRDWPRTEQLKSVEVQMEDTVAFLPLEMRAGMEPGFYELELLDEKGTAVGKRRFELVEDPSQSLWKYEIGNLDLPSKIQEGSDILLNMQPVLGAGANLLQCIKDGSGQLQCSWNVKTQFSEINRERYSWIFQHTAVYQNRFFSSEHEVEILPKKELDLQLTSFREVMEPGAKERWTLSVSPKGDYQLAATIYDASLDKIRPHSWSRLPLAREWQRINLSHDNFRSTHLWQAEDFENRWNYPRVDPLQLPSMQLGLESWSGRNGIFAMSKDDQMDKANSATVEEASVPRTNEVEGRGKSPKESVTEADIRDQLQETILFDPALASSREGEYKMEFTMGEALTEWNLFVLAHGKDLSSGTLTQKVRTKKDLMVRPYLPRFLQSGDRIQFRSRVENASSEEKEVEVKIALKDALSGELLPSSLQPVNPVRKITLAAGKVQSVKWSWEVPDPGQVNVLRIEITGQSDRHTDGEAHHLPIYDQRGTFVESVPLEVNPGGQRTFRLQDHWEGLGNQPGFEPIEYGLELHRHPSWLVLQSLPSLIRVDHEHSEALVNQLFALKVSEQILENHPQIPANLQQLEKEGRLKSPLAKNDEWKGIDIRSTPWLSSSIRETENMRKLLSLLQPNFIRLESGGTVQKLVNLQNSDGGWTWFQGGRSNTYMTQYVLMTLQRLEERGMLEEDRLALAMKKARRYCDLKFDQWFREWEQEQRKRGLNSFLVHYYYLNAGSEDTSNAEAWVLLDSLIREEWMNTNLSHQLLLALGSLKGEQKEWRQELMQSLEERLVEDELLGVYWPGHMRGGSFQTSALEIQSYGIELFTSLKKKETVQKMKKWLLKNKQTNDWGQSKATAAAVHSFLMEGGRPLTATPDSKITFSDKDFEWSDVSGVSGYYQKWSRDAVKGERKFPVEEVQIENRNRYPIWGSAFLRYRLPWDQVNQSSSGGLSIEKQYYLKKKGPDGEELVKVDPSRPLQAGEVLVGRLVLRVDRPMEFVHIKDRRNANLEPIRQESGYRYGSGLSYFESIKDQGTDLFIDALDRGTYIIELPARVAYGGECSGGVTKIECLYAPEFRAHTQGQKITTYVD